MNDTGKNVACTGAQAKGRRLRMARALAGLSRQELHEKTGMATSTVDTWESGRVELTEKSALRVCESFRKLGIYCSMEWLLRGEGIPPHLMSDTERFVFASNEVSEKSTCEAVGKKAFLMPPFLDISIKKELSFFLNLHEKAMFCIVKERFLNSHYEVGDCVAGIEENPEGLIGKIVILQNKTDELVLCRLVEIEGTKAKIFLNARSPSVETDFARIARVLWHRIARQAQ